MVAEPITTYRPTDLQRRYRTVLDEAKVKGEVRVQDLDGTSLSLISEAELVTLRLVNRAFLSLLAAERVLELPPGEQVAPRAFGEWTWLRVFDREDLQTFVDEIRTALELAVHEGNARLFHEELRAWRMTAQQLDDPLRREILLGPLAPEAIVEAPSPNEVLAASDGGA